MKTIEGETQRCTANGNGETGKCRSSLPGQEFTVLFLTNQAPFERGSAWEGKGSSADTQIVSSPVLLERHITVQRGSNRKHDHDLST